MCFSSSIVIELLLLQTPFLDAWSPVSMGSRRSSRGGVGGVPAYGGEGAGRIPASGRCLSRAGPDLTAPDTPWAFEGEGSNRHLNEVISS